MSRSAKGFETTLAGLREQFRDARRQEILKVALRVMHDEGVAHVSMQRMANELECAIGTIYQYVPSRSALLAELQKQAMDDLSASFTLHGAGLEKEIKREGLDETAASLVRIVGATWFWIAAEKVFPRQIELLRQLFTDPTVYVKDEDAALVLPTAMRLFDRARTLSAEAADSGALLPGSAEARAVIVLAGTTGVMLVSGLARFDPELFDGAVLAKEMARSLFLGWGAAPAIFEQAEAISDSLDATGRLVPKVSE